MRYRNVRSQSHHIGIETGNKNQSLIYRTALNRTILELKHGKDCV
ncbi:hypothetical protein PORCAN_1219 [Porphyromonas crevioricanis JCM 13913]|nr:hypothetical protein PORCAN_1219 [Porphyromonas crevioricanis JCM 13913]